jgi:hypothetical protein
MGSTASSKAANGSASSTTDCSIRILAVFETHSRPQIDLLVVHGLQWQSSTAWQKRRMDDHLERLKGLKARTLVLGCDASTWRNKQVTVEKINRDARCLLESICEQRRTEEEQKRPLMFLCHSLGGILVRRALLEPKGSDNARSILDSTCGIYFSNNGGSLAPTKLRKEEIPRYLGRSDDLYRPNIFSRVLYPSGSLRTLGEICIPLAQAASQAIIWSYKPRDNPADDIGSRLATALHIPGYETKINWICTELEAAFPSWAHKLVSRHY